MGVPGLSEWLKRHHENCFVATPRSADHIYVDINSMLHGVVRHNATEAAALADLERQLNEMARLRTPRISLTLAVDGPAPLAKLKEQRERRVKHSIKEERSASTHQNRLSTLCVTVGTTFMRDVDATLRRWARASGWLRARIVVDPSSHDGEGEVKLFRHLRLTNSGSAAESHLVLGGDADLALLALASPAHRVLCCDPQKEGGRRSLSIESFRGAISRAAGLPPQPSLPPPAGVSLDMVLLALLGGDDYLPRLKGYKLQQAVEAYSASSEPTAALHLDLRELGLLLREITHDGGQDAEAEAAPATGDAQSEETVGHYLSGLLWVLTMYAEARCPDYSFVRLALPPLRRLFAADGELGRNKKVKLEEKQADSEVCSQEGGYSQETAASQETVVEEAEAVEAPSGINYKGALNEAAMVRGLTISYASVAVGEQSFRSTVTLQPLGRSFVGCVTAGKKGTEQSAAQQAVAFLEAEQQAAPCSDKTPTQIEIATVQARYEEHRAEAHAPIAPTVRRAAVAEAVGRVMAACEGPNATEWLTAAERECFKPSGPSTFDHRVAGPLPPAAVQQHPHASALGHAPPRMWDQPPMPMPPQAPFGFAHAPPFGPHY
ncbi:hypothetical protein EMIHUDRAFT_451138 [Emiliania huxleyi CCMP1516]|uniref:Xrn1 N-terminal domain-containing protein n=2 Tax=Emiliania huxleyi TaxID=2903 RepID=A0A0D3J7N1_EMIH1|nr:hypothetical protein EMIHUDRAFT_451138 [Emiliania huxleyi CCMP1516]EOD19516.1 hypothetical protein EMIHUDRAFT_451138 [Emiliania huxleyi CCMP1516]|eukprot:XP_005771945.1 hypothetical protein EMIHUDRAFT_451138 [Emiliania huxleyi CCMP1516]